MKQDITPEKGYRFSIAPGVDVVIADPQSARDLISMLADQLEAVTCITSSPEVIESVCPRIVNNLAWVQHNLAVCVRETMPYALHAAA